VKQVAGLFWLQIDCLILVIVRSDYILPPLVRAVGPYSSGLNDPAYAHVPYAYTQVDHVIVRTYNDSWF
jgi:hypothetical protein